MISYTSSLVIQPNHVNMVAGSVVCKLPILTDLEAYLSLFEMFSPPAVAGIEGYLI